jgi:hypothetical protein
MTKSNDGCVIIVNHKEKTERGDVLISPQVLKRNVKLGTFTKSKHLKHNGEAVYVLTEDFKKL